MELLVPLGPGLSVHQTHLELAPAKLQHQKEEEAAVAGQIGGFLVGATKEQSKKPNSQEWPTGRRSNVERISATWGLKKIEQVTELASEDEGQLRLCPKGALNWNSI